MAVNLNHPDYVVEAGQLGRFAETVKDYTDTKVTNLDANVTSNDGTNVQVQVIQEGGVITNVNIATDNTVNTTDVNTAIEAALANYGGFKVVSLTSGENPVPDVSNPSERFIYLTKDDTTPEPDHYTEWIWIAAESPVAAHWEVIGETTIDLSDYATKVSQATNGNFASLNASGNLEDSGSKASDFATATALSTHTGDSTIHVTATDKEAWNGKQEPIGKSYSSSTAFEDTTNICTGFDTSLDVLVFYRALKLWDYIKDKISSALGLTSTSYGGKATTAGTADEAKAAASGSTLATELSGKSPTTHTHSVKINGNTKTIAASGGAAVDLGTYLTSHQSVSDSNPTLAWGTKSTVGTVGSTSLHVTMPSNPASNKLNVDGSNGTATGVSTLINKLSEQTSNPQDADFYVSQSAGGGTATTTYHRRPISALWAYIKSKISNDLGLNSSTYGGTSTRSERSVNWGAQADPTQDIYMTAQIEPSSYAAGVVVPFELNNKKYFGALKGEFAINYLVSILEATFQKKNGILLQVNAHTPSNPPITDNNWHLIGIGPEVTNGGKVALDIGINNSGSADAIITFQVMSQSSGGTVESTQSVYAPKTNTTTAVMGIANNLVAHHPYLYYKVASGSWDGGMTARWTVYNV